MTRMTEGDAAALVARAFDLDVLSAARLDTERDDSFHVVTPDGEFGFKLAHPDDPAALIDLQNEALAHVASAGLAVQAPLGQVTHEGRIGRLLTWLPGTPVSETTEIDALELGAALGRLNHALVDFDHPAARRVLAWDVAQAERSRHLLEAFPSAEAAEALRRFGTRVAPVLSDLPRQVVHNDFHPGNVLVDAAGTVTGILDFGDIVHTVRVADLAIALSYVDDHDAFVDGFTDHVALEGLEWDVLDDLIATRLALRMLLNAELERGTPDDRSDPQSGWQRLRTTLERHLAKGR
jgi:hydroxylysine kinase